MENSYKYKQSKLEVLRCFQYSEHYRRSFLPNIGEADARSRRTIKRLPEMVLMVSYGGQLPEARVYTCLARGRSFPRV